MVKDYFIDDISGILKNRLGISDNKTLEAFERRISHERAVQGINQLELSFEGYKSIHKHLFGDLYEWAGKTRGEEITLDGQKYYPNLDQILTKGDTQFAPTNYIESEGEKYFKAFKTSLYEERANGTLNADIYADKLAAHIGDVNFIHPFREGNGRTMRFYMDLVSKDYGFTLQAMGFDKDRWMESSHSAMNDTYLPLKALILESLEVSKERDDRDIQKSQIKDTVLDISVEKAGQQLAAKAGLEYASFHLKEAREAQYFGHITIKQGHFVAISQGEDLTLAPVKSVPDFERGNVTLTPDLDNRTYDIHQTQEQVRQQQKAAEIKEEQEIERE